MGSLSQAIVDFVVRTHSGTFGYSPHLVELPFYQKSSVKNVMDRTTAQASASGPASGKPKFT